MLLQAPDECTEHTAPSVHLNLWLQ